MPTLTEQQDCVSEPSTTALFTLHFTRRLGEGPGAGFGLELLLINIFTY
jgi:hypothetical protein